MIDYSKVRGFNYQPSYGTTSLENWLYFDPDKIELELRRGKAYFPNINTIRLWLSFHAWLFMPDRFKMYFDKALSICDMLGLKVVVCLFNRWSDNHQENGGIPLDYLIPGAKLQDWYVKMDE